MSHCCGGSPQSKEITSLFFVNGMTCAHCVMTIKRAVSEVQGVKRVEVSLEEGSVTVNGINVSKEAVTRAIQNAGYDVA